MTTPQRIAALPDIPSTVETIPNSETTNWHGMIGPKGLPKPVVDRMNAEVNKLLKSRDMEEKLQSNGVSAEGGAPDVLHELVRREIGQWHKVVTAAGVKVQ